MEGREDFTEMLFQLDLEDILSVARWIRAQAQRHGSAEQFRKLVLKQAVSLDPKVKRKESLMRQADPGELIQVFQCCAKGAEPSPSSVVILQG